MTMQSRDTVSIQYEKITEDFDTCRKLSSDTIAYCLKKRGRYALDDRLEVLIDSAVMSSTCLNFIFRGSKVSNKIIEASAEIYSKCINQMQDLKEDIQIQNCIRAWNQCLHSCKILSHNI